MKIDVVKSGAPRPLANYSEAMVAGPWIFAAGQLASDFKTGVPAEARKHPNFPFYGSDIKLQTRFVLENLKKTFEAAGSSLDNVFKAQVFLTDLNDFFAFDEVWKEYFKVPPARTTVGTTGLLVKDTLIEIDLIGFVPGKGVDKQVIKSNAPRPLAHYNEGFKIGDFVYAAGQIASDYKTGVPGDAMRSPNFPFYNSDIKLQTRYILENLKKTFEAAGSSLDNVFKAQVFLTDLDNFNGFDEVWKEYFKVPPARTTVGTTGLLVKDTLVEIDLIGCVTGKEPPSRRSSRVRRSRLQTTRKPSMSAVWCSPPASSPAISSPAFRRKRGGTRTSPTTTRTSSCRPASSWKISRRRSKRPEVRSTRSSRRRSSSPISTTSTASTRCGRNISKSRHRARRSARPACW